MIYLIPVGIIAICSLTWTDKMVGTEGLFSFLPRNLDFLPEWLLFPLFFCPICLSGWISIVFWIVSGHYLLFIPLTMVTMYITGLLKKYLNPYE